MQYASILIPQTEAPTVASLNSLATSSAIEIGVGKKFSVTAVDANMDAVPFQVAFGTSTVAATSASEIFVPGKYTMSTGNWTHISIYNPTSAAFTYCVAHLSNT